MTVRLRHLLNRLLDALDTSWHEDERLHWKHIAERYAQRQWMDGTTIRGTGEVIPRDSA